MNEKELNKKLKKLAPLDKHLKNIIKYLLVEKDLISDAYIQENGKFSPEAKRILNRVVENNKQELINIIKNEDLLSVIFDEDGIKKITN